MFKKFLALILSFLLICPSLLFFYNVNASEKINSENLHKKSDLEPIVLDRLRHSYSFGNYAEAKNKKTENQFLGNSLIFDNFFTSHSLFKDLLVVFENDNLAKKFICKEVDIFGVDYGHRCDGGTPGKTACIYGGVTFHENNINDINKGIPINLWLNGEQKSVPLSTVSTNKKNVTVQELDAKVRKYLSDEYKLYESDSWGGKIERGFVNFDSTEGEVNFDLYEAKGEFPDSYLRIYQDNKTVSTEKLHIDIYLFTK